MQSLSDICCKYDVTKKDARYILETLDAPKDRLLVHSRRLVHYKVTDKIAEKFEFIANMRENLLPELESQFCDLNKRTHLPIMVLRSAISYLLEKNISITEIGLMLRKHHSTVIYHKKNLEEGYQHPLFEVIEQEVHSFIDKLWDFYA